MSKHKYHCYGDNILPDFTNEEKQEQYQKELLEYEAEVPMTPEERQRLHQWVSSGHSVHEHPDSRYICLYGAWPPPDFLSVYRMDREIKEKVDGMTETEKEAYLKAYIGYDDGPEDEYAINKAREQTPELIKEHVRKLARELFYLWDYIGHEGLWTEAHEYVDDHMDEPTPFEW